jgi:hypothetical protein
MTIEIIHDSAVWDSFVDESPDRVIFHSWKFLKIVEKYSGYTLLSYGIFEKKKNTLIALFPLFYHKRRGMRFIFSQPPMSGIPFIGLLMNAEYTQSSQRQKEHHLNTVVTDINSEIEALAPHYVSISLGPFVQDIRPFLWNGFDAGVDYTYTVNLQPSLEDIWNSFERTTRKEIRSTAKYNLSLKETGDIEQFYAIMEERYRQQHLKLPLFGFAYLKEILATFPDNLKLYFLYNDQQVIEVGLNYEYNKRFVFWIGGVNLDRSIHGLEYYTWEFVKLAKSRGLDLLEIQGADIQRLSLFKSKFNPCLEHSFHVHKKGFLGKCAEWSYIHLLKGRG